MSKYKVGDKVVMEIAEVEEAWSNPAYLFKNWQGGLFSCRITDMVSEPLGNYTEPLEAKIRRQAAEITRLLADNKNLKEKSKKQLETSLSRMTEITRLLAENKELKKEAEENYRMGVNAEYEKWKEHLSRIRAVWQNEAWELALKLRYMGYEDKLECFGLKHDGEEKWVEIMEKYTYQEAAAKVAQWEKAKEEIKVGDIFEFTSGGKAVVMKAYGDGNVGLAFPDGSGGIYTIGESWHKTGRHIDIESFLRQIGEE